tara:strand:+ start:258 stop:2045 length:1788 start_codon:yes stop_codon:yes gene_type:complete
MASTTTVNGTQAIKTLNNLNMEGKFKEDSLRQFSNLNTAVITYTSTLGGATAGSNVKLYDAISETEVIFTLRESNASEADNEFTYGADSGETKADNTAQNLVDRINDITLQGTATNNHYSAIIEYFAALNSVSPDGSNDTIVLETSSDGNNDVTFTMIASGSPTATQFLRETNADTTATNLCNAINNHSSFSAIIDITKNIIIITQISTTKPANNTNNFEDGDTNTELKLTNFSNFSATISKSTNTITVTQNTSKSHGSNSKTGFDDHELSVTNFNVNTGDEAAIPSETIGTYQILNKVITDLSSLKKSIITRNKTLQKDVSNDADDEGDVTLTSTDKTATHQSIITADKSRGNLTITDGNGDEKPSVFKSDSIWYSEDALFTLLKGLGYEIFKFNNGVEGNNNGGGDGYAGLVAIPISITPQTPHTTGIATLSNVTATIHNINRSDGSILPTEDTSVTSIPHNTVGLIQLINAIINNITLIKRSIKTRELAILTALQLENSNPTIDVAILDSKITTLKTRGGLLDDTGGTAHNLHKPSIFTKDTRYYSEDAVFSLFSCISYELMKLLKGKNGSNNGASTAYAGLQVIPASIESI